MVSRTSKPEQPKSPPDANPSAPPPHGEAPSPGAEDTQVDCVDDLDVSSLLTIVEPDGVDEPSSNNRARDAGRGEFAASPPSANRETDPLEADQQHPSDRALSEHMLQLPWDNLDGDPRDTADDAPHEENLAGVFWFPEGSVDLDEALPSEHDVPVDFSSLQEPVFDDASSAAHGEDVLLPDLPPLDDDEADDDFEASAESLIPKDGLPPLDADTDDDVVVDPGPRPES
jgi:hypothetical protein